MKTRKKEVKKSVAVIKTYKKNKCFFLDKKKGKVSKRNQIKTKTRRRNLMWLYARSQKYAITQNVCRGLVEGFLSLPESR